MEQKDFSVEDKIIHQIRGLSHMAFHGGGRKMGQMRIIKILYKKGDMSQKELQELLEIQPGSLSEILNKIEGDGLIRRQKNEQDKRQIDLELTELGRKTVEESKQKKADKQEELFKNLSLEEREQLSSLLDKLMDGWKLKCNGEDLGSHGHGAGCGKGHKGFEHRGGGHHKCKKHHKHHGEEHHPQDLE
ncbi:MAG TPA: MarR family transcriptional regulator [Candidatus Merdenecus merdavium]|nr:MarR family transcriptional regulator [Candidatus Merdenecus merdavium]